MQNRKGNLQKLDKEKDTINMSFFVNHYLMESGQIDCKRLRHKDLKTFNNPLVVPISFETASSNYDLIRCGKVLMVLDCNKNPAPYINPQELIKLGQSDALEEEITTLKKETFNDLRLLSEKYFKLYLLTRKIQDIEQIRELLLDANKSSQEFKIKHLTKGGQL